MSSKNCLNCGHELSNNFCSYCGQKADTHRITVKHFIQHDLLHGVFHLDKGILFTIKETFTRPGKAAMDYINGKRVSYYNVFYLLLILIGLNLVVVHYVEVFNDTALKLKVNKDGTKLYDFFNKNIKYIILSFIPLFAINGLILFRRLKLNFAEHHIISGFVLLGCSIIALFNNLLGLLPISWQESFFGYLELALMFCLFVFPCYVYYMAFAQAYKIYGFIVRIILMYFFFIMQVVFLTLCIAAWLSKGSFEGTIKFA
jgi:hypothetical protein